MDDLMSLLYRTDRPGMECRIERGEREAALQTLEEGITVVQASVWMTPMTDEPRMYGRIAACHALGQLYALGVKPELALNMAAFPGCLGTEVLEEILQGGAEAVHEAGAVLAGGHSISDDVPKYGLSVSGFADKEKLWALSGARPGDVLVLTKPLGTGALIAAAKAGQADEKSRREAMAVMAFLNRRSWELALSFPVHGCTMVDGRGFLGTVAAMASGSRVRAVLEAGKIPLLPRAEMLAEDPAPAQWGDSGQTAGEKGVVLHGGAGMYRILCTPETSGGLLFSLPEEASESFLFCCREFPEYCRPAVVGRIEGWEGNG